MKSPLFTTFAVGTLSTLTHAQNFEPEQVISTSVSGAQCVYAADLDGDGDYDVLSASNLDNKIAWYENLGGGTFGPQQTISTSAFSARTVYAADLDGDGDNDVLAACASAGGIFWYENLGGGFSGAQQVITTSALGARSVFAADLDADGDIDVLSASFTDDKIAWYENLGLGIFGAQEVITTNALGANTVHAADLDGDGDIDVLSTSSGDSKVAWYENLGGVFSGAQQVITTNALGASSVYAEDLDGDGDNDVLSSSYYDNKIAFYENLGGGSFGAQQVITTFADTAASVYAKDLDGDGDNDVLSASNLDDKIAWYENVGGAFGPQRIISTTGNVPASVYAADLDGDGDNDVLSAAYLDNKIAWYENQRGALSLNPDNCFEATAISGDGVYAFDATSATTSPEGQNESLCYSFGSSAIVNDVWFEWTSAADGTITVSTCGDATEDTRIAAYEGAGCPVNGSAIACNDDAPGCAGFTSSMSFAVTNGSVYMLQVGHFPGSAGGTGNLTITTTAPPTGPNPDNCDEATAIAGDGVYAFDATLATTGTEGQSEALCYAFGQTAVVNDVWFEWTSDTDGTVNVSTCGDASSDTRIAAYPGAGCPGDGAAIACNDDADGCAGYTSSMDFACTSGSVYMIQVGHFPGTPGGTGNITVTQTAAPTGPGAAYCFGDGSGTPCPCGNAGSSDSGCANDTGNGAILSGSGSASIGADNLVLSATNLTNGPGLFFQGNNAVNSGNGNPFGDGLRCAGFNVIRLEVQFASAGNNFTTESTISIANRGGVSIGDVRRYQYWYRDSGASPCNAGFNLTNGYEVTWEA